MSFVHVLVGLFLAFALYQLVRILHVVWQDWGFRPRVPNIDRPGWWRRCARSLDGTLYGQTPKAFTPPAGTVLVERRVASRAVTVERRRDFNGLAADIARLDATRPRWADEKTDPDVQPWGERARLEELELEWFDHVEVEAADDGRERFGQVARPRPVAKLKLVRALQAKWGA